MPKQTYLHKRLKSAVYYFRCLIPNDLISSYDDKREITFSLKTRDHHEAMRRVSIEAGKLQTEFEKLRRSIVNAKNPPKPLNYTDAEIERLSLLWTRCVLETDDKQRMDGYVDESFDEQAERLIDTSQDLKKIYARGELEKIYPALNGFLALMHTAPPDDPMAYRRLPYPSRNLMPTPPLRYHKSTKFMRPPNLAGHTRHFGTCPKLKAWLNMWKNITTATTSARSAIPPNWNRSSWLIKEPLIYFHMATTVAWRDEMQGVALSQGLFSLTRDTTRQLTRQAPSHVSSLHFFSRQSAVCCRQRLIIANISGENDYW
jgi:hypothetical protein